MKRRFTGLFLIVACGMSLIHSGCGDDTAKRVERLRIYTESAIEIVADFERGGMLTPKQAGSVRATLVQVKDALNIFIGRARELGKIDSKNKAELARLFAQVAGGVREVMAVARPLVESAIAALGNTDAEKRIVRASALLTGIETAARIIESRLSEK